MAENSLIKAYLSGLGAAAVWIGGPESMPVVTIGVSPWPADAVAAIDGVSWAPIVMHAVAWFISADDAERVAQKCRASWYSMRNHRRAIWFDVASAAACESLIRFERRLGLKGQDQQQVFAHAQGIADRIEHDLERMKARGELKSVNRAYQQYRKSAAERRADAAPFRLWFEQYKVQMLRVVGEYAKVNFGEVDFDIGQWIEKMSAEQTNRK